MTAPWRRRGPAWWLGLALGVAPPLVLWWWRSAGQTPDGLSYALDVRRGVAMWHPHHLLYVPVARALHSWLGFAPLTACLVENLAALPLLVWAAHGLARRLLPGVWQPWAAVGALLATRGVMFYATHAETYLPALAWCAVLLRLALATRPPPVVVAAGAFTMAMFYHQTNAMLAVPLLLMAGRDRGRRRWIIGVVLLAAVVVLAAYVAAWRTERTSDSLWAFATTYARAAVPAWGRFDNFGTAGALSLALSQARNLVPAPTWLALPALLGLAALAAWHGWRLRARADDLAALRRFALGMLACYLTFFLWWMPQDPDFFLVTVLPLWVLGLLALRDLGAARPRWAPAAVAGALFAGNFWFTVVPMHGDPGPDHRVAMALDASTPHEARLIVGYATEQELLYYTDRVDVHEGTAYCRGEEDAPASAPAGSPAIIVEGGFLQDLLAGRAGADVACVARIAEYDAAARRCRVFIARADGGLAVSAVWRPAASAAAVIDEIRMVTAAQ